MDDPASHFGAWALLFVATLVFIALRSFQQLNVQHDRALWVVPTSFAMAFAEVLIVLNVVTSGSIWSAVPMGCGAGLGCLIAMRLHKTLRGER